ncbi:hypothetical protein QA601_15685 [Chitinispirillales bacterium ANBcel5]|uniref:hypothetical protein n=1 Tax=Cellulosispirillum alkaliphilum TaxID=3039283 RepID=UPI002A4F4C49|nr:hypothetical protein [Chitinispirillales bacterium ANBcel5]
MIVATHCTPRLKTALLVTEIAYESQYSETVKELQYFIDHGERQINQICRRCFKNEIIPHSEKVFSDRCNASSPGS